MKTKFLLLFFLSLVSLAGYCQVTISATSSATRSFSPDQAPVIQGESVTFVLNAIHDAVEVSQATWDNNGTTALPNGFAFSVGSGGGTVPQDKLTVGTHYYVCQPHVFQGMKGIIIVSPAMGIQNYVQTTFSVFPNPADGLITLKTNENTVGSAYGIADQWGRLVVEGKLNDDTTSTQVDISQLAMGVYFVQIGDERRQSFKLIKK